MQHKGRFKDWCSRVKQKRVNGNDKIAKIKGKLTMLPSLMNRFIKEAFGDFDSEAEDRNIEQLQSGERSDGSALPDYSIGSVKVYGKPEGAMTLKDTGAFHKSITLTPGATSATIAATDPKTDMLKDRYGDEIIGLSEENDEEFKTGFIAPAVKVDVTKFMKS